MATEKDIKAAIKAKKLMIGRRSVIRGLKSGDISSVVYSSNCPDVLRKDLEHYASVSKASVKGFGSDSVKLGEICGKPFNVLVAGIKK